MRILAVQGSPDPESFSAQLTRAYTAAAREHGHDIETIDLSAEDFDPVLRYGYRQHMDDESAPKRYQEMIRRADHLTFLFPIWWSAEPAVLKGFLDRVLTPGFSYSYDPKPHGLLTGKTASLIVTSRAPAPLYRLYGGPLSRWKHMVLAFNGIRPKGALILGNMDTQKDTPQRRAAFTARVRAHAQH